MNRILIGLAAGSGLEGVDAAIIDGEGVGLDLKPQVLRAGRVPFPLATRDQLKSSVNTASTAQLVDLSRNIVETAVHAVRTCAAAAGMSLRDIFAGGWLEPSRTRVLSNAAWAEIADRLAEQTGITFIHNFRIRDRSVGGSGHPIGAAADYLLFQNPTQERLLLHLGAVTSALLVRPRARVYDTIGFETGPGNQLLDALSYHGTRGRDTFDAGGKKAVQGQCLEPLLQQWLDHPHLTRTPPKSVHADAFARSFLLTAFDSARQCGATLSDLLCTATHLIARSLGDAVRRWLPAPVAPRRLLLSGGGVRNGFLWQLLGQQFEDLNPERTDVLGIASLARNAASAAVLATLTCDGVAGNLPSLTGASGARTLGHFSQGDRRNWARCTAWLAEHASEYPRANRAA